MTKFHKKSNSNSGFTLVELLLVISILAVLASLSLVVIAGAQTDARRSATQSRISLVQSMLQQRVDDFQVRRIPLKLFEFESFDPATNQFETIIRSDARELRNRILLEYIKTEMPRSVLDVARDINNDRSFPSQGTRVENSPSLFEFFENAIDSEQLIHEEDNSPTDPRNILTELAVRFPSFASRFLRANGNYPDDIGPSDPLLAEITTSSEYLYLILQMTDYQGTPAIEFLGGQAFGDTDSDGYQEIVDAFGFPISFAIEMHDDTGRRILQPTALQPNPNDVGPNNPLLAWQVDSAYDNT